MKAPKLTRRAFVRLCAFAATGAVAAACDPNTPQPSGLGPATQALPAASGPPATTMNTPTATPARLALAGGDGDVWGWKRQVTGTIAGNCPEAYLGVGAAKVEISRGDERFSAVVPLSEGQNTVSAVCRQQDGREDRSNVRTYTVPLKRRPTAIVRIAIEGDTIVLDGGASQPDEVGGAKIVKYLWSMREDNPAVLTIQNAQKDGDEFAGQRIVAAAPTVDGEYYVALRVVDAEGRADAGASYFVVAGGQPRVPDYDKENPAWVEQAVVYGVIPRKFGDPAFQGITKKLDYLKDLGIDALWLSPINRSPAGDFGYAVVDYFDVNPDFGTKDDLKRLVEEAHARGIRVLMDFVPNHTSDEHPYFQDAQARGKASAYYDFYDRDESGAPTHYFDWENLPNLNYNNPEVERFITEAFSYWVREFDVDGFRTDACWGVKERKPDFWPMWRRELKRIKPDLLLLAEASARDLYYFDHGFDAAYDWTAQLGHWAWEIVFDSRTLLVYNLNTALTNNGNGFHPDALIFRFLNNNDTGTRFITERGEELTRVAAALLLTLPGIPCVYTGDEIGAWFRPYYDELPLAWNENKYPGLRDYYKHLIALRKMIPSLRSRQWQPLEAQPSKQVYGYVRYLGSSDQPVLVLLNFSDQDVEAEVPLPQAFAVLAQQASLRDALAGESVAVKRAEDLKVPLPAWRARVLSLEE
ncbi:MAG: alpha-amylase family glycosyl hydrolase [Roseiflexaceae bacterium]